MNQSRVKLSINGSLKDHHYPILTRGKRRKTIENRDLIAGEHDSIPGQRMAEGVHS